jgi:hypothetical protein
MHYATAEDCGTRVPADDISLLALEIVEVREKTAKQGNPGK